MFKFMLMRNDCKYGNSIFSSVLAMGDKSDIGW